MLDEVEETGMSPQRQSVWESDSPRHSGTRARRRTAWGDKLVSNSPVYYGWVIAALVSLSALIISPAQVYCVGVVVDAIIIDEQLSRMELSGLYATAALICAPVSKRARRCTPPHPLARARRADLGVAPARGCSSYALSRDQMRHALSWRSPPSLVAATCPTPLPQFITIYPAVLARLPRRLFLVLCGVGLCLGLLLCAFHRCTSLAASAACLTADLRRARTRAARAASLLWTADLAYSPFPA